MKLADIRRGAGKLCVLRIARLRIDEHALFLRKRVRRDSALDHRSEVFINLIIDLRYRLRMKHPLTKPSAARKPVGEVPTHLLEFPAERAFGHLIFQKLVVAMQYSLLLG